MQIVTSHFRSKSHIIYTIAIIGSVFTLHMVIPMYSNSSFLGLFASERILSFIYMAGAAITILGYLLAPIVVRKVGNYKTAMALVIVQMILFYNLATSDSPIVIAVSFMIQLCIAALISLTLDIFLEKYTENTSVGRVRGLYTATLNATWIIGPLLGSMIINGTDNYRNTYVAGLAMLLPLLYLIYKNFPRFKDPNYTHLSPSQLIKHIGHNANWVKLFVTNIILQTFYAWMVVYSPIYLNKVIGFGWEEIGIILVIMLLPFPLIQYPLGWLADKRYGEKEIMAIGFGIIGITTISLVFVNVPNVALWALMLFLTRVGAAMAEIMIETYFFKTVSVRDAAALGVFRITRPVAYFIAPTITIVGLLFVPNAYLFVIIGIISLLALYPVLTIKDTN